MSVTTKGGRKRAHKGKQAYQAYLRGQVRKGKGHGPDGHPATLSASGSMGRDLLAGYNFK